MKFLKRIALIFLSVAAVSCKTTTSGLVLLKQPAEAELKVNSACRASAILPVNDEPEIKKRVSAASDAAVKKNKFKVNESPDKCTHKIVKVEYIVTETCADRGGSNTPPLKVTEKLVLENLANKEIVSFESDTLINNQHLSPTPQTAPKKTDFRVFITPLTEMNYTKAKQFFKTKK